MSFFRRFFSTDRWMLTASIGCLTASVLLLGVRSQQLHAKASNGDDEFLRFVDVAAEVYGEIKGKYVDDVEGKKVLEGALAGMFSVLDEHSQYMDPRMLESLNKDTGGNFSGIGIHITQRQGLLTVIAPIPGSPSAKLGIMPWDRIIEIDGKSTEGMTLQDAVDKLTGPSGTQVKVKIFREGEKDPLEFTITRAQIKIDSVYSRLMEDKIGYLRIARFSEQTSADMRRALVEMKGQGMRGLILDLRFNSGGLLREAIEVSNLFVPKNEIIVSTKGRLRSQNREYRASEPPMIEDMPVFVLVNEGSASASEIVAGALQDHKLAAIIGPAGKNTFGKGSVQTIEQLRHSMYDDESGNAKESALRLTTARYYTPSGRTIHHIGITPDIGVPLPDNHEGELLRNGLYGDTTIPLTAEEKKAQEEEEKKAQEEQNKAPEGGAGETPSVVLQRSEGATPTPQPTPEARDGAAPTPFYAAAKKPEIVKSDFKDVLLEEAAKQMKIYMILNHAKGAEKATADAPSTPATSATN